MGHKLTDLGFADSEIFCFERTQDGLRLVIDLWNAARCTIFFSDYAGMRDFGGWQLSHATTATPDEFHRECIRSMFEDLNNPEIAEYQRFVFYGIEDDVVLEVIAKSPDIAVTEAPKH